MSTLDAELTEIRTKLAAIVRALKKEKYAFVGREPLGEKRSIATKLRKLEKRVGRVPLALARFWAIVGAVDLRGNHPAWARKTWIARANEPHWLADPLVVTSIDAALADVDACEPDPPRRAIDLAGDDLTKANFSGDIVWIATSDAIVIDAPLVGRKGTFLEMLRDAIAAGGFPGLTATDRSRRR